MLLACFFKGTLILIAAFGVSAALRKASAAARHLVWTAAFAALLLLPLLSRVTPVWTAPVSIQPVPTIGERLSTTPAAPYRAPFDWVFFVWLTGATLVVSRFLLGTARVWLKVRRAQPMQISGLRSGVPVLDAGPHAMPMTWGILRPVVLLPSEAADWPADRLRIVLLHELAHVDRRDCLTLAVSELALAFYWFQPLAWWAASRMRREREQACDDRVLADGIAASDYAGDLVHIAQARMDSLFVAPAMARGSNMEARLKAILDPSIRRRAVTRKMAVIAVAAALVALLPLASLRLQAQGAGLSGIVYDPSGSAVPGASVSIASDSTGATQTVISGPVGNYSFPDLAAGSYQLTVRQPGFQVFVRKAVTVPGTLDAFLSIGRIAESMTVSGKRSSSPTPPATPQRIRVGGMVQAAKILLRWNPSYPPGAEAAGIEGTVMLQGIIGKDGGIIGLTVLSTPSPELAAAAMTAVQTWRYSPTLLNGEPVEVITAIDVNFRLNQ